MTRAAIDGCFLTWSPLSLSRGAPVVGACDCRPGCACDVEVETEVGDEVLLIFVGQILSGVEEYRRGDRKDMKSGEMRSLYCNKRGNALVSC